MSDVKIRVLTEDEASAGLAEVDSKLKGLGDTAKQAGDTNSKAAFSFTELKSALSLVNDGLQVVQQGYDATVGKTLEYADTVRTLSMSLGISASETSRLIQVSDDYGVSAASVGAALEMATKNGFAPSVESLAQLADQVNAMSDPTERAATLSKIFGRNWSELLPILNAGGDAIRDKSAAVSDSLILDEQAIAKARALQIAQDDLNDQVDAFTMKIGQGAIPKLTDFITLINKLTSLDPANWFREGADASAEFINSFFGLSDTNQMLGMTSAAIAGAAEAAKGLMVVEADQTQISWDRSRGLDALGLAYQNSAEKTREYKDALQELSDGLSGKLGPETEAYTQAQEDLKSQVADVITQIDILKSRGYSEQSQQVKDLRDKYGELLDRIKATADEHDKAMKREMLNLMQQQMAVDGLTTSEIASLEQIAAGWGLLDTQTIGYKEGVQNIIAEASKLSKDPTAAIQAFSGALLGGKSYAEALLAALLALNGQTFSANVIITEGKIYNEAGEPTTSSYGNETGGTGTYEKGSSDQTGRTLTGSIGNPGGGGGGDIYIIQNFNGPLDPNAAGQAAYNGVLTAQRQKGAR